MAVTNNWTGVGCSGHTVPSSQFTKISFGKSSSSNLNCFFLGCGHLWSNKTCFSPRVKFTAVPRKSLYCCHGSSSSSDADHNSISTSSSSHGLKESSTCTDWDWNRWTRHFSDIEQAENYASLLKFQLEDAIEKEDFEEAVKLKKAIAETNSKDSVAEIMSSLKSAIDEERYHDASSLSRDTGSGLVGWWVGCSKDSDDPFGRLVHITPAMGRFIGRSYTPRQLVTGSPGTPLFEIFVVKDDVEPYIMQVVYMHNTRGSMASTSSSPSKSTKGSPSDETENKSVVDIKVTEENSEKSEEKGINIEEATEEGIKSVLNFLKDKIPGLKVKVMNVDIEEVVEDGGSVEQLLQEDDEETSSDETSEDEAVNFDEILPEGVSIRGDSDTIEEEKELDVKLFLGGVVHNKDDAPSKEEYMRLPAEIRDVERNSFLLRVPGIKQYNDRAENKVSKVKVAAIEAKGISELMPSDVAKAFWNVDKVSPKISRDVREIVKLAVSRAQSRSRLGESTTFSRITPSKSDLDPFDGLYVGAFGPYGTEVVQLKRKFGHWNASDVTENPSDLDFFEYVEAVKLTGDLNVPAGQVSFRAKIGKGKRNANRGLYPEELGVVASYKGQGRIAEFGFRNPQWVDGELLLLSGKGMGPYVKGADLGFLFVIPDQSFLVLFNRLKLPE